jgi:hypothetical protein
MNMVIQMNDSRLATLEQVREFLAGTVDVSFPSSVDLAQSRQFAGKVLKRFQYSRRSKPERIGLPANNSFQRLGVSPSTLEAGCSLIL